MSEPFIAEIRIFAGNFAPRGWAFCNGQLLPVAQNTSLFSIIGTTYGGDGRTTTALPDLRGRAPMHPGRGPGLTARQLGQRGGTETVTLQEEHMPAHTHDVRAASSGANAPTAGGNVLAKPPSGFGVDNSTYHAADGNMTDMSSKAVDKTGGGQAFNIEQPFLAMNFIIALVGQYPSRS